MWSVWESWSLKSSQTIVHSSSGLKLKVCLFCPVICMFGCSYTKILYVTVCVWYALCLCLMHAHICMYLGANRLLHACFNAFICAHVWFCIYCVSLHVHPAERNNWVTALQDCTRGRHRPNSGSPLTPDYQGYLELRGLRSKLYTVVASDKVFLYKNVEVRIICVFCVYLRK